MKKRKAPEPHKTKTAKYGAIYREGPELMLLEVFQTDKRGVQHFENDI